MSNRPVLHCGRHIYHNEIKRRMFCRFVRELCKESYYGEDTLLLGLSFKTICNIIARKIF